jgi:hypothetical protein
VARTGLDHQIDPSRVEGKGGNEVAGLGVGQAAAEDTDEDRRNLAPIDDEGPISNHAA